jgi:excinuclease UvrABC ATPase subunit
MGQAKKQMMDRVEEERNNKEIVDFLKNLYDRDELKNPIDGIAKYLFQNGIHSLSEKQKAVVDNFIEGYKNRHSCKNCQGDNISNLSDYIEIADCGLCPMCQYEQEQLERD